jgi:hypothetical protein
MIKKFIKSCWTFGTNPIAVGAAILWKGIKEFAALSVEGLTTKQKERRGFIAIGVTTAILSFMIWYPSMLWLLALAPVAFIQNMFFTLVSRSRNSQDTDYHRFCAWGSNGVWFICQVMIVKNIWTAIMAGQWWYAIAAGVVYSLATTEGSVLMMKRLIKSEKGKRRVGANDKTDQMLQRIQVLERMIQPGQNEEFFEGGHMNINYTVLGLGAGLPKKE